MRRVAWLLYLIRKERMDDCLYGHDNKSNGHHLLINMSRYIAIYSSNVKPMPINSVHTVDRFLRSTLLQYPFADSFDSFMPTLSTIEDDGSPSIETGWKPPKH